MKDIKVSLEKKILLGFIAAFVVLIGLGAYSLKNNQEYFAAGKMVTHTNEVLYNVERLMVATLDVVVGQRGFELTGDEAFLEPYYRGLSAVGGNLKNIRELTRDNHLQQKRLDTLEILVNSRNSLSIARVETVKNWAKNQDNSHSGETFSSLNSKRPAFPFYVERIEGLIVMNQIRAVTGRMQDEEKRLLVARIKANEEQISESNLTFILLILFMAALLTFVFLIIRVNLKARKKSEEKVKAAWTLLEAIIESQSELQILSVDKEYRYLAFNSRHKEATRNAYGIDLEVGMNSLDGIPNIGDRTKARANFDRALAGESHLTVEEFGDVERSFFETRYNPIFDSAHAIIGATAFSTNITERKHNEVHLQRLTDELSVANKELEAFCYSVSHDLRAPLRSINGYSRILLEDYGSKLDNDGRKALDTVMRNALMMGQLIDDLLNFSRIGKSTISQNTLAMDKLVSVVLDEQLEGRQKKVTIDVGRLIPSIGDTNMIKQVWTNLLSNAFKYSGKKDFPKIEVGSWQSNGSVTYYVKDNGVGFDMQYSHKLFGVFQRLHKSSDFEGTGVGLALVGRVISRHGGKVWAESKPDVETTFYFSLPLKPH